MPRVPTPAHRSVPRLAIGAQAAILLASGLLAFMPPERGAMLVVPILPGARIDDLLEATGSERLGIGPWPGSRYVAARREDLLLAALSKGMVVLRADPRLCGTPPGDLT